MMEVLDYTTCDAIRAVLGVAAEELEDSTILQSIYDVGLNEDLEDCIAGLPAYYDTLSQLDPNTLTALQSRFLLLTQTWAAYDVAVLLLNSVQMFAPVQIQANRDAQVREDDPYSQLRLNIQSMLARYKTRMLEIYQQLNPAAQVTSSVVRVMSAAVPLGTDPVTGV